MMTDNELIHGTWWDGFLCGTRAVLTTITVQDAERLSGHRFGEMSDEEMRADPVIVDFVRRAAEAAEKLRPEYFK